MQNMGYACINMHLSELKPKITTNRSMIKRTFLERGIEYASELSLQNCQDLIKIIQWNHDNGFKFFRLSSELFPWASEYNISDLPDYDEIKSTLAEAGRLATEYGIRITTHPGPFNVLTSPSFPYSKITSKFSPAVNESVDILKSTQRSASPVSGSTFMNASNSP